MLRIALFLVGFMVSSHGSGSNLEPICSRIDDAPTASTPVTIWFDSEYRHFLIMEPKGINACQLFHNLRTEEITQQVQCFDQEVTYFEADTWTCYLHPNDQYRCETAFDLTTGLSYGTNANPCYQETIVGVRSRDASPIEPIE